jgi:hypothetical protein
MHFFITTVSKRVSVCFVKDIKQLLPISYHWDGGYVQHSIFGMISKLVFREKNVVAAYPNIVVSE